jgi:hypothetical protein
MTQHVLMVHQDFLNHLMFPFDILSQGTKSKHRIIGDAPKLTELYPDVSKHCIAHLA